MASDNKYGTIDIEGIPDDEPVFVLRAQDVLAVPIIARYRNLRVAANEGESEPPTGEWLDDINHVMERFEAWQAQNRDSLKLPD